jgi:endonuclease G, mitochondrial
MKVPPKIAQMSERWEGRVTQIEDSRSRGIAAETLERRQLREVRLASRRFGSPSWGPPLPELAASIGKERVVGPNNLQDVALVATAAGAAQFVARVGIQRGEQVIALGTGFTISPTLLMTNNHVLPTTNSAAICVAQFDYQLNALLEVLPEKTFRLRPDVFFHTNSDLDYTIVAIDRSGTRTSQIADFAWFPLREEQGKINRGEPVNIIQHPNGEYKKIAVSDNRLLDLDGDFLLYTTDTEPGSSGSPVMNEQWEIVGLHHRGVPKRDAHGNYLDVNGAVATRATPDDKIWWMGNEGTRTSALVSDIKSIAASSQDHRKILSEIFDTPPSPFAVAANKEKRAMANDPAQLRNVLTSIPEQRIVIPIELSLTIGGAHLSFVNPSVSVPLGSGSAATNRVNAPAIASSKIDTERAQALSTFREASARKYLDESAITSAIGDYYQGIQIVADATANYETLSKLVVSTHRKRFNYKPALHLYPWIDLHKTSGGLKIKSIYSGKLFDPAEFIEADFDEELRREALRTSLSESLTTAEGMEDFLEAQAPFNCEHVVPQSWFAKKEPMRGDLHHLFACESGCNSFRGNIPYFDFDDYREAVRTECGKREAGKFEPESGKGAVARAVLYFLLRYPGEINDSSKEYEADRIETLRAWATAEAPDDYERHRNQAIFEVQGNRNPFIDHPDWVTKVELEGGLG